jgi:hypothetical protein
MVDVSGPAVPTRVVAGLGPGAEVPRTVPGAVLLVQGLLATLALAPRPARG